MPMYKTPSQGLNRTVGSLKWCSDSDTFPNGHKASDKRCGMPSSQYSRVTLLKRAPRLLTSGTQQRRNPAPSPVDLAGYGFCQSTEPSCPDS
ncbi:syncytin-2 isoform X2 [Macaca fascicularis]|uniref:syncytin-2 isoform X2 n=1 Tax=Macaca fascicularis TaxID=9541 RepID=UPI003D15B392